MSIDEARLNEFVGKVLGDFGATLSANLVNLGDRLGLYKAMAGAGPLGPAQLAERTGTNERYVRDWLHNQAASGYVQYDPATRRFELADEQAAVLADENSPVFLSGGFESAQAIAMSVPRLEEI